MYFYELPETISASKLRRGDLEMSEITLKTVKLKEVLPPCNDVMFTEFKVPWKFFAVFDVALMINVVREEGREEGRRQGREEREEGLKLYPQLSQQVHDNGQLSQQEPDEGQLLQQECDDSQLSQQECDDSQLSQQECDDSQLSQQEHDDGQCSKVSPEEHDDGQCSKVSPEEHFVEQLPPQMQRVLLKGSESIRNERFEKWLKQNLATHDIKVLADKQSDCTYFVSRFARSREDFCFFPDPSKLPQQKDLKSAAITVTSSEDEATASEDEATSSEDEDDFTEYDLIAASGDCKDNVAPSDNLQLMANMDKTVAEVAWEAINSNKLFKKITVYGLLIDYTTNEAKMILKMVVDYNNQKTTKYKVVNDDDVPNLSIQAALERVTSIMNEAVASKHRSGAPTP